MTDDELQAQLDLADARLDVANGRYITPERYRDLITSLHRGREAKAAALADATRERQRARRAAKPKPTPMSADQIRAIFQIASATDTEEAAD